MYNCKKYKKANTTQKIKLKKRRTFIFKHNQILGLTKSKNPALNETKNNRTAKKM